MAAIHCYESGSIILPSTRSLFRLFIMYIVFRSQSNYPFSLNSSLEKLLVNSGGVLEPRIFFDPRFEMKCARGSAAMLILLIYGEQSRGFKIAHFIPQSKKFSSAYL